MGQGAPTRMVVELETAGDHLGGWLVDGLGSRHRFDSWLEFASVFSAATRDVSEEGQS